MKSLPLHDLRKLEVSALAPHLKRLWSQQPGGLWSVAKRPHKKWTKGVTWARALILSSAPLFELILWIPPKAEITVSTEQSAEQTKLFDGYSELFKTLRPDLEQAYATQLLAYFEKQEPLYQKLESLPFVDRAVRELRYEQQGLKRGLAELATALNQARSGCFDKGTRDRIDLDFYHLLEHHIEREQEAIIPCWLFLNQG